MYCAAGFILQGTSCASCPVAQTTDGAGGACTPCPSGTTTRPGGGACFPCGPGQAVKSDGTCSGCPIGQFSNPGAGLTACTPCSTWYNDPNLTTLTQGGLCTQCPTGTVISGVNCVPCPDGSVIVQNGTTRTCSPCPAGNSTVGSGSSKTCVTVPSGFYINYSNSTLGYSPCPQNSISNSTKTACVACSPGTAADLGSGTCVNGTISGISYNPATGIVSWNPVQGATSYNPSYAVNSLNYSVLSTTTNSFTLDFKYSGATYTVSIAPVIGGVTLPASTGTFTLAPTAITNVGFGSITPTSVVLTWSGGQGASLVSVSTGTVSQSLTGSGSTFAGLSPGQTYNFTLIPYSGTVYGQTTTAGPITTPPSSVSSVNFTNIGTSSVTINWSGGTGATSYTISCSDGSTKTATASGFTYSGLNIGTVYTFTITPTIGTINGAQTSATVTTSGPVVSSLSYTNITPTSVTINWSGGTGATSYTIKASDGSSKTATASPYTYTGLVSGTAYTFTVTPMVGTASGTPLQGTSVSTKAYALNAIYTGSKQTVTLQAGTYTFTLGGGSGGAGGFQAGSYITSTGGNGEYVVATFTLNSSTSIQYIVGQQGSSAYPNYSESACGGGGGASYIYDVTNSRWLFVAGGGGGAGALSYGASGPASLPGGNAGSTAVPGSGSGGATVTIDNGLGTVYGSGGGGGVTGNGANGTNGASGGGSWSSGSTGGSGANSGFTTHPGGFGGGGGSTFPGSNNTGGGGGGYTGGAAGTGGTSYAIANSTIKTDSPTNTGNGFIQIY